MQHLKRIAYAALSMFLGLIVAAGALVAFPALANAPAKTEVAALPASSLTSQGVVRVLADGTKSYTGTLTLTDHSGGNWFNYATADVYVTIRQPISGTTFESDVLNSADGVAWDEGITSWQHMGNPLFTVSDRVDAMGAFYEVVLIPTDGDMVYTPTVKVVLKP